MAMAEGGHGAVIVGTSIGGYMSAVALREHGYRLPITLIGEETHLPYSRPALSKQVLSGQSPGADTALAEDARLQDLGVRFVAGVRATALDTEAQVVWAGGRAYRYGIAVLATGASPVALPSVPTAQTLRTLDDAISIRDRLRPGLEVTVVGGGVLGCELAAVAAAAGSRVTLLARGGSIRIGAAGALASQRVAELLREHGVGIRAAEISSSASMCGKTVMRLTDGSELSSEMVLTAVGCTPTLEWLSDSGLELQDGIVCDANGRAGCNVFAVGDVARWRGPHGALGRRVEHQTKAIEQAHAVGAFIANGTTSLPSHPFFWSEIFGTRIQVLGVIEPDSTMEVIAGDPHSERFVISAQSHGAVSGVVGWNMAREFRNARTLMPNPWDAVPLAV